MLVIQNIMEEDLKILEDGLHHYDYLKTNVNFDQTISFGVVENDEVIAGIKCKLEGYKIMYVETLFVKENYRHLGLGSTLIKLVEEKGFELGVKIIRLDTFSWQAKDFYIKLGYEIISSYLISDEMYEYFMMKRI